MATRNLYATLIGINDYKNVPTLNGCVNDILNIDRILRGICDAHPDELHYEPLYLLSLLIRFS